MIDSFKLQPSTNLAIYVNLSNRLASAFSHEEVQNIIKAVSHDEHSNVPAVFSESSINLIEFLRNPFQTSSSLVKQVLGRVVSST